MTAMDRSRVAEILRAVAPLAVVGGVAAVLLIFPPARYSFYPECPIYKYLHVECPGCGTTRALAALLRGHVAEAFRWNALTTVLAVPGAVYAGSCYRRFLERRPLFPAQPPAAAVYAGLAVAVLFGVARNLA
jgi:hypothetical protein